MISRAILVVLALGLVVFQQGEEARGKTGALDELTLEQQVGQLLVLSFSGTTAPEYVRKAMRERRVAGVILFGGNITGPSQLRELTGDLRRQGGRPIVAVDQEGGAVRRLPWAGPLVAQPEQVRRGTVRADAAAAARQLRAAGVTVTLAPVVDVPSVRGAALAGRAFSSDPSSASDAVRAAVRGWRSGGVAATAKHFPGIGGAPANTDDAIVTIRALARCTPCRRSSTVRRSDRGRRPARDGRARAVPGARHAPGSPRSRGRSSRAFCASELGFRGVVVTDSMEARASLATGSTTKVSERAIRAGADLLLLTGRGSYRPVYDHLLAVAKSSPAFRARVLESAARVLALKRRGARPPG